MPVTLGVQFSQSADIVVVHSKLHKRRKSAESEMRIAVGAGTLTCVFNGEVEMNRLRAPGQRSKWCSGNTENPAV